MRSGPRVRQRLQKKYVHAGVRVVMVGEGVIERTRNHKPTTCWNGSRFLQIVSQLPLKIIACNLKERFPFPIGQQKLITHTFATKVHVRKQSVNRGRLFTGVSRHMLGIIRSGRYIKIRIDRLSCFRISRCGFVLEINGDLRFICLFRSIRGVMHLDGQLRYGWKLLSHSLRVIQWTSRGSPANEEGTLAIDSRTARPFGIKNRGVHDLAVARIYHPSPVSKRPCQKDFPEPNGDRDRRRSLFIRPGFSA